MEGTTGSPIGLSSTGPVPGEEQPCTSVYVGDNPSVKHLLREKDLGVLLITQVEHELAICPCHKGSMETCSALDKVLPAG